uniref:Riboflavin transporter n=1 Tax=Xenopus tropicalis TaxID=8364 RepID=A0A803J6K2_XENTR
MCPWYHRDVTLGLALFPVSVGWTPAFLTGTYALGNIGPLAVTLSHRFCPRPGLGAVAHTLSYKRSAWCRRVSWRGSGTAGSGGGEERSVRTCSWGSYWLWLHALPTSTSCPSCQFPAVCAQFFIWSGLSALRPVCLALGQGVGRLSAAQWHVGESQRTPLLQENFPASSYFWGLFCFLGVSAWPSFCCFVLRPTQQGDGGSEDSSPLKSPEEEQPKSPLMPVIGGRDSGLQERVLTGAFGLSNALTNGILPSVQTYSCLPYGRDALPPYPRLTGGAFVIRRGTYLYMGGETLLRWAWDPVLRHMTLGIQGGLCV